MFPAFQLIDPVPGADEGTEVTNIPANPPGLRSRERAENDEARRLATLTEALR